MSIKVGITGGIGAGKSTVAKIFELLSVPVYDADSRAKALIVENMALRHAMINLLGTLAYTSDGQYDSVAVSKIVFEQPVLLQQLNKLVHPAVASDFQNWAAMQSAPYILKEAALLIESGSYLDLDYLIVVTAPEALRIKRVQLRDSRTQEQIKAITARQLPEKDKLEKADFVITNDDQNLVIPQVLAIDFQLGKM